MQPQYRLFWQSPSFCVYALQTAAYVEIANDAVHFGPATGSAFLGAGQMIKPS